MKMGKISENILKRSVLKQIQPNREEIKKSAGIGENCAIFSPLNSQDAVISVHTITIAALDSLTYGIHKAANNIAAYGAEPVAVELAIILPPSVEEIKLRKMMEQAHMVAKSLNIQIAGGDTKVSDAVLKPVVTVTGIGQKSAKATCRAEDRTQPKHRQGAQPGQDIVLSKWIGIEATALLSKIKEKELLERYPHGFIQEAKGMERYLSVIPEAATAVRSGVCAMHDASEGGIFGALWEFAQGSGVGLIVDLKKIPIRQETIEVSEYLGLNPYEILSGGCLIMAADNGTQLVDELEREGIPANVIGKITEGNDRIVMNQEERRFLDFPKPDGIYQILHN